MITIALMIFSARTGAQIDGVAGFVLADIIIAWFICNMLTKIFG